MPLSVGGKLGPYEIIAAIGRGGMGEVWKARDQRLNRDVAIKTSLNGFSGRFRIEAQSIAALNHPNICTLYDIGPDYLVMEYIEGTTLAERMRQGPIPQDEALAIAKQIAHALDAAQEKGIVHRDLKPANIKIRPDGSVKVLDFGLAKAAEAQAGTRDSSTLTVETQAGTILGTAGYMSPEQARGQAVDKRADIWAFGVLLYEMVTGSRLFDGATISDSLVAILTKEPDLSLAPETTRRLLGRCLEKDPKKRLRDIGDAWGFVDSPAAPNLAPRNSLRPLFATLALALLALVTVAVVRERSRPVPPPLWVGTVLGGSVIASHPRISPDGQLLAFRAIIDNLSQVAVMKPGSSSWTVLTHDSAQGAVASLAWARDGSRIYFDREWGPGRIYSIGALGGEPRLVLDNAWIPEPLPDGSLIAQRPSSEGRQQLLRFWPDSGRTQVLPATVQYTDFPNVRAFPDGQDIAVFGLSARAVGPPMLFTLNLQSLEAHPVTTALEPGETVRDPIAVTPDNRSILIQRRRDDTVDIVALPRSGSAPLQTLISLPGTAAPISLDAAPDGSLYMDHSGFELSILSLGPAGTVLADIPVPQFAGGAGQHPVVFLGGGAAVFDVRRRGRWELFVGRSGAEPQLLLNTPESASLPGALLGAGEFAFVIQGGAQDAGRQPHIAVASLHDGRIIRRYSADAGLVTGMSAPADGKTIYYASNGVIWAQPVSGGEPRKIGAGYDIAVEPSEKFLYLMRTGADGHQLFRIPATGGEASRVVISPGFTMTPEPLSPTAVDRQGRIILPVNVADVFFYRAAILDPARSTMKLIAVPPRVVISSAGWTPEGNIAAVAVRWSSVLWRYRSSTQSKAGR